MCKVVFDPRKDWIDIEQMLLLRRRELATFDEPRPDRGPA